jgi:hypothetical protein
VLIRVALAQGELSQQVIAKMHGVNQTLISAIKHQKIWAHVEAV